MAAVVAVVLVAAAAAIIAWRRRNAPVPIGEGIRALGRVGQYDDMPAVVPRPQRAARRRQQVRLASTACLSLLAVTWIATSFHRALAVAFALVLLLRVLFERLARHP